MPWAAGTLTDEDVAGHVGVEVDERLTAATNVARAYCERRRFKTLPYDLWSDPAAHDGGMRYAGLLYRSKAAPAGFASYEAQDPADYTEFARAMDHIGQDVGVA